MSTKRNLGHFVLKELGLLELIGSAGADQDDACLTNMHLLVLLACQRHLVATGVDPSTTCVGEAAAEDDSDDGWHYSATFLIGEATATFNVTVPENEIAVFQYLAARFEAELTAVLSLVAQAGEYPAFAYDEGTVDFGLVTDEGREVWRADAVPRRLVDVLLAIEGETAARPRS